MTYNSELFIHDLDKRAFDALNNFPNIIKLREAYIANYDERAAKYTFLSSAIRLSDKQMPDIYNLLPPICEKLDYYFIIRGRLKILSISHLNIAKVHRD